MIHVVTVSLSTLRLARYSFSFAPLSDGFNSPFSGLAVSAGLAPKFMLKALLDADVDLAPKPAKPEKTFFFACQKGKRYQDQILSHITVNIAVILNFYQS